MANATKVVFLSRHTAEALMLQQLEEKLGEIELIQFKGTYSDFSGRSEKGGAYEAAITFTEMLEEGEAKVKNTYQRSIPADAVIVGVMPPQLQIAVLNAIRFSGGKATLLQPLTNRVSGDDGKVTFEFVGLNQVHKVEIVTSTFSGGELAPAHERR